MSFLRKFPVHLGDFVIFYPRYPTAPWGSAMYPLLLYMVFMVVKVSVSENVKKKSFELLQIILIHFLNSNKITWFPTSIAFEMLIWKVLIKFRFLKIWNGIIHIRLATKMFNGPSFFGNNPAQIFWNFHWTRKHKIYSVLISCKQRRNKTFR
jgi:hypothetical protein